MLQALTWLCIGWTVLLGPGGESEPHGLLEKSSGRGPLGGLNLYLFARGLSLL